MPDKIDLEKKRSDREFVYVIAALAVFGIIFTAAGFTFAATQEQHDSFCASCHTQPKSTYFERSIAAAPTDLASFHTNSDRLYALTVIPARAQRAAFRRIDGRAQRADVVQRHRAAARADDHPDQR